MRVLTGKTSRRVPSARPRARQCLDTKQYHTLNVSKSGGVQSYYPKEGCGICKREKIFLFEKYCFKSVLLEQI